jgi:hypothetical protein
MTSFIPLEINGHKYLMCKLPDQPFSTLHDPETKQIVGQLNNLGGPSLCALGPSLCD